MPLTTDPKERKATPIYSGVVKYFPLALAEVARVSKAGNDQHNPGQPLHWDKSKSTDHLDCIARHLTEAGSVDTDGMRHSAKLAWRALAALETELEVSPVLNPEPPLTYAVDAYAEYEPPLTYAVHAYAEYEPAFFCREPGCACQVIEPNSICHCHDR